MITITPRAAEEIGLSILNPENQGMLLRFAINETEAGFQYLMGFDERTQSDVHLQSNGIEYVVSYAQKDLFDGMVVDFDEIDTETGYGFIFMNPNDPNYEPPKEGESPEKAL